MSLIKTDKEIVLMRESCGIVSNVLKYIKQFIQEGITTREIDRIAEDYILSEGGKPAFKGYRKFPATLCISVNEQVVHGIPGDRKLNYGDIVSVDVGVLKNGYYGDSAFTYEVCEASAKAKKLIKITRESLYKGIEKAIAGNELNDISSAVQNHAEGSGFGVVRELVGHGIGKKLHEEPAVPNFYSPEKKFRLYKGMTLAIEPMINYGTYEVETLSDGWTVVTKDNEPSAHFEHTVLITNGAKTKPSTAFHNFCNPADIYEFLFKFEFTGFY